MIDKALREMSREIGDLDLNTICNRIVKRPDYDDNAQAYLIEQIAANTHMGKRAAGNAVGASVKAMRERNKAKKKKTADDIPVVNEWSDHEMADWAQDKLASASDESGNPLMYTFEGDVADMHEGRRRMLSLPEYQARTNGNT